MTTSSPNPLSYLGVRAPTPPNLIKAQRAPNATDTNYDIGTLWLNEAASVYYGLVSVSGGSAVWDPFAGGTAGVDTLTGDTGGAISPVAGNINILGGDGLSVSGAGNSLTVNRTADNYPITPYVVGPAGEAGYATVQAAIDAANAAGGGTVYVQNGSYTENLTLYDNIQVVGVSDFRDSSGATITGVHTPPAAGSFTFKGLTLASATHIFNSAVAGTTHLIVADCAIAVTNGYTFNLTNWTGDLEMWNCDTAGSTNDGAVNNAGGSSVYLYSTGVGAGTGNTAAISGPVLSSESNFYCPLNFGTGSTLDISEADFFQTVTFSGNSTGTISQFKTSTGATAAFTMSSTADVSLLNGIVNSSNNPVIAGAGAGTLTLGSLIFVTRAEIASTLTVLFARAMGQPTPYVIGNTGTVPHQPGTFTTIQDAIDLVDQFFGPKFLYLTPGLWAEDLDFTGSAFDQNIHLVGLAIESLSSIDGVYLSGTHNPPTTGRILFEKINLASSMASVISSVAAGSAEIVFKDCTSSVDTGYMVDATNWTGDIKFFNHKIAAPALADGGISNTGGSAIFLYDSEIGTVTGGTMTVSGAVEMRNSIVNPLLDLVTGADIDAQLCKFNTSVTCSNNSTGEFNFCTFDTGATAALTMSSSAAIALKQSQINSSNDPAIAGAGAGTLTILDCAFVSNNNLAATLTVATGQVRGVGQFTRFTVGAAPDAPYATVQAAVDAANAAGGGVVVIQPGTYTENLTLYDGVSIYGTDDVSCIITGVHTPPAAGTISFENLTLTSATDILSSAAAGTTDIYFNDVYADCTNGYTCNLANWTGTVYIYDCVMKGANNGVFTNSATADFVAEGCIFGDASVGTAGNTCTISGSTVYSNIQNCTCYLNFSLAGGIIWADHNFIFGAITTSNAATVKIWNCNLVAAAVAALTHNSSTAIDLTNITLNSSNTPALDGSGVINLQNILFTDQKSIAGTLTVLYDSADFFTSSIVSGSPSATVADIECLTGSIKVPAPNNAAGASPQATTARTGKVIFTDVINTGAYGTLTMTNGNLAATSVMLLTPSCTTANSALVVADYVPGAGTVAIRLYNAGSANTANNIEIAYWILN